MSDDQLKQHDTVSDTPRTDAETFINEGDYATGDFARQLERELAGLRAIFERDTANDSDSLVASCSCLAKTNDIQHHKKACRYRLISERNIAREQLTAVTKERDALRDAAHSICGHLRKKDKTLPTFPEVRDRIATLTAERDALRLDLIAARKQRDDYHDKACDIADQRDSSRQEVARLRSALDEIEAIAETNTARNEEDQITLNVIIENVQEALSSTPAPVHSDTEMLDWLEDIRRCYFITVLSQPSGKVVYEGQGRKLRAAIDAEIEREKPQLRESR